MSVPARASPSSPFNVLNPLPVWKTEFKGYTRARFLQDLLAGVTVGIVALPLALAFGVTSGAGAAAGLITAIIAGLVASAFGGSRFQITGPTGAMTVVLLPVIAQYGLSQVFVIGLLAGCLLILASLLRLGRAVHLIPWPVITGFTNGIAVIIALQQLPAALGLQSPRGEGILLTSLAVLRTFLGAPQLAPLALTAATAAIMLAWPRVTTRVPGGIIALLTVTGISLALHLDVPRIGVIPAGLPLPHFPTINFTSIPALFSAALAVAVLAGLESLLSAVVADGMTRGARHAPDRELFGQGLANIIAPLFGGIPATGAIARTAVGVRSGGQTRLTGIIHALFLLLVVLLLGRAAALIPLSVLAGILLVTALRMFETHAWQALRRSTRSDFFIMLATLTVTVAFDLILAIEVGLALAGVLFIQQMIRSMHLEKMDVTDDAPSDADLALLRDRVLAYRVEGPLFFGVAGRFLENLTANQEVDVVILRLRRVHHLDASGAHALEGIHQELQAHGVTLLLSGMQPQPLALLTRMALLGALTTNRHHLFETTPQAIEHAWSHVQRRFQEVKA
ncbi:SulP family inorganic anion transporter [Deinococcus detaillensis]|uniref:SulP family inorganic anion transporter n=1 Tax=Deinococcus detaillensis TaxID=2592048 RepID=A0A553UJF7_9DEIO|nr:SulP family inorganic anion transporter [Deinococcus detaillensis]TSA80348.1 SulP family inorganic anion transporter [Deinococcus detaillensis]